MPEMTDREFIELRRRNLRKFSFDESYKLLRLAYPLPLPIEGIPGDYHVLCDLAALRLDLATAQERLSVARTALESIDNDISETMAARNGADWLERLPYWLDHCNDHEKMALRLVRQLRAALASIGEPPKAHNVAIQSLGERLRDAAGRKGNE